MRVARLSPASRLLAAVLVAGLVLAACGGDDDGDTTGTTEAGGTQTTEAEGTDTAAAGEPVPGGTLVFGLEADTSSPWTPANMTCASSCYAVARSVYDPLTLVTDEGEAVPNLATVEPNDDHTVWTITARDGVTFHDGTPFDGAAVADNLNRHLASFLTAKALADVQTVEVDPSDPMVVRVTMSRPWVAFDYYMSTQTGFMASPTWLAAADADPALQSQPVGTGPFVFESYTPGGSYVGTRNEDYWREGLPYLDRVEYRVIADATTRQNALLAGDIDIMHTTNGESIAAFREDAAQYPMEEYTQWGATGYWLMQVGDPESPLSDQRVRCALAQATDIDTINQAAGGGVNELANGPYSPERTGYLEDTGYPTYDPDAARAAVEAWEAENGPLEIAYATTNDSNNLLIAQLVQQMWSDVGIDSTIDQIEQGQFIVTALQGDFQVFLWRNHTGPEPDGDYIWWHSSNALPEGQLGLNFGRISDPVIDENLDVIHSNPDPAARQEAAENINRRFAEQCYNLWYVWPAWGVPHTPNVQGLGTFTAPDGELVAAGEAPYPQSIWLTQ